MPDSTLDRRTFVYSTLDDLVIGQLDGASDQILQIPRTTNLTLHALGLTLVGRIEVPGGDVQIYCQTLNIPAPTSSRIVTELDVSAAELPADYAKTYSPPPVTEVTNPPRTGRSGADIASGLAKSRGSKYGAAGAPGGRITILCQRIHLGGPLHLYAKGGLGFPGCDGESGGPSAGPAVRGGNGGDGQRGGPGGAGGTITVRCTEGRQDLPIVCNVDGGAAGQGGKPGEGGRPGGEAGSYPEPVEGGAGGRSHVSNDLAAREFGAAADEVFLLKVLQRVKYLYLRNQPTNYQGAIVYPRPEWASLGTLLGWLVEVLSDFGSSDRTGITRQRKGNVYDIAEKLLLQYGRGDTYFGWAPAWVPNLPVTEMFSAFKEASQTRKQIEDTYLSLNEKHETATQAQKKLDNVRTNLRATQSAYEQAYIEVLEQLTTGGPLQQEFELAMERFTSALDALRGKVTGGLQDAIVHHFDCNIDNILRSLESFAFTGAEGFPAVLMAGAQTSTFVYNAVTKVTDDRGRQVDKTALYSQIVAIEDSLVSATRTQLFTDGGDGSPQQTAGTKLLLVKLDEFDKQISELSVKLGHELTRSVSSAIDEVRAAIAEKGRVRIHYNTQAKLAGEYLAKIEEAKQRLSDTGTEPEPLSPYWTSMVAHHAMLYQDQLDETAKAVAMLQRKVDYLTLEFREQVSTTRILTGLWTEGRKPTAESVNELEVAVAKLRDTLGQYGSQAASAAAPYPSDPTRRGTLTVHITDPESLEFFKQHRSLSFSTVPASATGQCPPRRENGRLVCEVSDSRRYYDVRVNAVRPRIIGAHTASGLILVSARLAGTSGITDAQHKLYTFSHQYPRVTQFVHRVDAAATGHDNDDLGDGPVGTLTDSYLDAVGMFGDWFIKIPEDSAAGNDTNAGLRLDDVTGIKIYFSGYARSRAAARH